MTGLGRGRIVLVASVNGRFGGALSGPAYAASKGGLSRSAASSLGTQRRPASR
jgi:NAD(P)-dependent dehydrogenase (short-subunit alcohol dehydrogenase family)